VSRARLLYLPFAVTGFSGLVFQVVWQRVISIHAGIDLASSTTVVAAFMAGLGLGSLLGGSLADRLTPRRAVLAYAASTAGVGLFGYVSMTILYDGYQHVAPGLPPAAAFGVHFALLLVPTTLMGLSLPLLVRGAVAELGEAALKAGRLYAVNTLGAALGAGLGTWFLLGNMGFVGAVHLAAGLNMVAAAFVWGVFRDVPEGAPSPRPSPLRGERELGFMIVYALTGAAALGLEVVYFRVVDTLMRSNSYTFGHVLMLYLLCFAAGAAWASRRAQRSSAPEQGFLWIQLGVGLASLAGLLFLVDIPPVFGMRKMLEGYFATDGYLAGPQLPTSARSAMKLLFAHLTGPLLVMGVPVFLMGAAYPYAMQVVARRHETLGRHTGQLLFANIAGNVAGSIIVGFVLIDALGTAGTVRLLGGLLACAGVVAGVRAKAWGRACAAVSTAVALLLAFPSNDELWRFFHSAAPERFFVVEERGCVDGLVGDETNVAFFINGASQNNWPYDDFHVLIGMMPALMHESPRRAMAVGLGIGSTAWGMLRDARIERVDCAELCGGQRDLIAKQGERGAKECSSLLADARLHLHVEDGRKHLLSAAPGTFDVITVDALRPNTAYSGSTYSLEFYRLVASRLTATGLFSQWVPTPRVEATAARAFPHVVAIDVPGDRGSFFIGSKRPITLDRERARAAVEGLRDQFTPEQHASLLLFFEAVQLRPVAPTLAEAEVNRDLKPRDEYWLNDG